MTFAKGTKTAIADTEQQIKKMLQKAGADTIGIIEEPGRAVVAFHLNDRAIQFRLPLPARSEHRFLFAKVNQFASSGERPRDQAAALDLWVQACRERWRALHLCIKAKLESVEQNIESFDDAFLAHIQMPDGETVGDKMRVELAQQLAGRPPRPLLGRPTP